MATKTKAKAKTTKSKIKDSLKNVFINELRRIEKEKKQLYIKYKTMDEFSSLEDSSDMTSLGSDKGAVSAGASPLSSDKRASIHEFIATFEEKKRAKKKVKVVTKKDDTLIALSPLTSYINQAYA